MRVVSQSGQGHYVTCAELVALSRRIESFAKCGIAVAPNPGKQNKMAQVPGGGKRICHRADLNLARVLREV